jgi:hypothetical protein
MLLATDKKTRQKKRKGHIKGKKETKGKPFVSIFFLDVNLPPLKFPVEVFVDHPSDLRQSLHRLSAGIFRGFCSFLFDFISPVWTIPTLPQHRNLPSLNQ